MLTKTLANYNTNLLLVHELLFIEERLAGQDVLYEMFVN